MSRRTVARKGQSLRWDEAFPTRYRDDTGRMDSRWTLLWDEATSLSCRQAQSDHNVHAELKNQAINQSINLYLTQATSVSVFILHFVIVCPMQCCHWTDIESLECSPSDCITYRPRERLVRSSSSLKCRSQNDDEDQVRWPITPKVVHAHVHPFTSGLAHFSACVHNSDPISRPILIKFGL